jgi:hypothetical protein
VRQPSDGVRDVISVVGSHVPPIGTGCVGTFSVHDSLKQITAAIRRNMDDDKKLGVELHRIAQRLDSLEQTVNRNSGLPPLDPQRMGRHHDHEDLDSPPQ